MITDVLHVLLKHALVLCDEKNRSNRTYAVKEETVKLLCTLGTVKTNRFYIPGETKIIELLRKQAFDKGIFATLTYIYNELNRTKSYPDIKEYIKEKVLNLIELRDLVYHSNVAEA
jgi:hypothetical protein